MSVRLTRRQFTRFGVGNLPFLVAVFVGTGWGKVRRGDRATPAGTPGATPLATPLAATPTSASRPVSVAGEVEIEIWDDGYRPAFVQATNGHDLEITLKNMGSRPHGFQIPRLKVDVTLDPGARKTITISGPLLGEFPFTSDAPGDGHLTGLLVFYI